ncbi:MAG: glutathione-dependent disulfide-bond oxidoreductase [Pseudomonadota bacterium]|nr:MAG: glutathione-dependent disulfide-bond oxidoreductase [Pseudomonadota bacterium]
MNDQDYVPPEIWRWEPDDNSGQFASINRPTAGAQYEQDLPVGGHPHQLYSLATPNGVKAAIMFEELLERGIEAAEYDAWLINIGEGEQFSSGFVRANPNSKIPALVDLSVTPSLRVFESGAIVLYLAEKFSTLLPSDRHRRTECLNWVFWQMGATPYLGGGFGHFYNYAPVKIRYAIDRYTMETKRQLDVLDRQLAERDYIAGDDYTIADIVIWPWYGQLALGRVYDAAEFLQTHQYENLMRWARTIDERPAVRRGRMVNRTFGRPETQLHERHDPSDFELRTQDKIGPPDNDD